MVQINEVTRISVKTIVGETDKATIFDSICQGSVGAALISAINIGVAKKHVLINSLQILVSYLIIHWYLRTTLSKWIIIMNKIERGVTKKIEFSKEFKLNTMNKINISGTWSMKKYAKKVSLLQLGQETYKQNCRNSSVGRNSWNAMSGSCKHSL